MLQLPRKRSRVMGPGGQLLMHLQSDPERWVSRVPSGCPCLPCQPVASLAPKGWHVWALWATACVSCCRHRLLGVEQVG